jgi:hypothetical protein
LHRILTRRASLTEILGLVIVAPVLTVWLPSHALKSPDVRINVPNRAYWLSPDHRNETVNTIRAFMIHFASLFTVFLAYAHWLIVQANLKHPPIFPSSRMIAGIAVLLAAACVLIRRLVARFRIPSNAIKSDT